MEGGLQSFFWTEGESIIVAKHAERIHAWLTIEVNKKFNTQKYTIDMTYFVERLGGVHTSINKVFWLLHLDEIFCN